MSCPEDRARNWCLFEESFVISKSLSCGLELIAGISPSTLRISYKFVYIWDSSNEPEMQVIQRNGEEVGIGSGFGGLTSSPFSLSGERLFTKISS